jgi:anti-sigma factor RsiW
MSTQKCGCSKQLIAWFDGELSNDDYVYMERHVAACVECRTEIEACKKISVAVQAYCEAAATSRTHRSAPLRVLPYVGAAAVAAGLAFFLLQPHPRVLVPAVQPAPAPSSVLAVPDAKPASMARSPHIKPVRVRDSSGPTRGLESNSPPEESAIEIAIPADALFPLGGAPQGVAFVADLSIAPDGSPQRLHLEPQLIQFERSR